MAAQQPRRPDPLPTLPEVQPPAHVIPLNGEQHRRAYALLVVRNLYPALIPSQAQAIAAWITNGTPTP